MGRLVHSLPSDALCKEHAHLILQNYNEQGTVHITNLDEVFNSPFNKRIRKSLLRLMCESNNRKMGKDLMQKDFFQKREPVETTSLAGALHRFQMRQ